MVLFDFRNRTQSMKLYDLLRTSGVECEIIYKPHGVAASFGLSARDYDDDLDGTSSVYNYYDTDSL